MLLLFILFWLLLFGRADVEIACFGAAAVGAVYCFLLHEGLWSMHREQLLLRSAPMLLLYLLNLLRETVLAALAVLALALHPTGHPDPVLVEFHSGLDREYLNVLLANSITLTPGTITVFQEGDHFLIHALRREFAQGLEDSSFVRLLRRFPR